MEWEGILFVLSKFWPVLLGLFIQGPGLWFIAWLRQCATENRWVYLPFEPKYISPWIVSLLSVVAAAVVNPDVLDKILSAENWQVGVLLGVGWEHLVGKVWDLAAGIYIGFKRATDNP